MSLHLIFRNFLGLTQKVSDFSGTQRWFHGMSTTQINDEKFLEITKVEVKFTKN